MMKNKWLAIVAVIGVVVAGMIMLGRPGPVTEAPDVERKARVAGEEIVSLEASQYSSAELAEQRPDYQRLRPRTPSNTD